MKKIIFGFALCVLLFALSFAAEAQQPKKVPRIGYVSGSGAPTNPGVDVAGFPQGLRDLGYTEGKDILVEYRYAEGMSNRMPSLVAELVQLKVDVVVLPALPAIRAAKQATKTIPIVMKPVVAIRLRQAWWIALPDPAAMSPALQTLSAS